MTDKTFCVDTVAGMFPINADHINDWLILNDWLTARDGSLLPMDHVIEKYWMVERIDTGETLPCAAFTYAGLCQFLSVPIIRHLFQYCCQRLRLGKSVDCVEAQKILSSCKIKVLQHEHRVVQ